MARLSKACIHRAPSVGSDDQLRDKLVRQGVEVFVVKLGLLATSEIGFCDSG